MCRPERGNALDLATSMELLEAFRSVTQQVTDGLVRVVILAAEGKRFCVGGDLEAFRAANQGARLNDIVARPLHDTIKVIAELPVPVIAAVQGSVGGGGVGLVLACDLAVATDAAALRLGYTGSGLSPDCGVTWDLPRRIGPTRAADLLLTNRRVGAAEAAALGLLARVVPAESLDAQVAEIAAAICAVPPLTIAETKRLMRSGATRALSEHLDDEAVTIGVVGDTGDARRAMTAFLDRAPVQFRAVPLAASHDERHAAAAGESS